MREREREREREGERGGIVEIPISLLNRFALAKLTLFLLLSPKFLSNISLYLLSRA